MLNKYKSTYRQNAIYAIPNIAVGDVHTLVHKLAIH